MSESSSVNQEFPNLYYCEILSRGGIIMILKRSAAFLCSCLMSLVLAAPPQGSLEVHLTSGNFRGLAIANGTDRWLGIPFAQPPVGPLRFKAPLPITKTTNDVTDAFTFGDACPQTSSSSLGAPIGEDCLMLNVCVSYIQTPRDSKRALAGLASI